MRACCYCPNAVFVPSFMCCFCKEARKPFTDRARRLVASAISRGDLPWIDLLRCVDCGARAERYEHHDYNRPLDVEPVCHRCNVIRRQADWDPAAPECLDSPFITRHLAARAEYLRKKRLG